MLFRRFVAYLCASVFTGDCQHPGCRDSLECTQQRQQHSKQGNDQVSSATLVAVKPVQAESTVSSNTTVVAAANNRIANGAMSPCKNVEVKVRAD